MRMEKEKGQRGFTLIELLVVIAIFSVMAGASVLKSRSQTEKYARLRGEAKQLLTLFRGSAAQSWGGFSVVAQVSTSSVDFFIDIDKNGSYTAGTDERIRLYTPPTGWAKINAPIKGGGKLELLPRGTARYDYTLSSTTAPNYTAASGVFLQITTVPAAATGVQPGWYSFNLNARTGVVELIEGYAPLS